MSFRSTLAAVAATVAVGALAAPAVSAQDLEGCDTFQRYVDREDFPRALEELTWCRNSVEELHFQKLREIVERNLAGYDPVSVSVEAALGFAVVEAEYSDGTNRLLLSLTGGAAGGSQASAGLGAIAGLASAFGVRGDGQRQARVSGISGMWEDKGDSVSFTGTLEGGIVMVLEGVDEATVEEAADEIVPPLEDYIG